VTSQVEPAPPPDVVALWGQNVQVSSVVGRGDSARATCELRVEVQMPTSKQWALVSRTALGRGPRYWPDSPEGLEAAKRYVAGREAGQDPMQIIRYTTLSLREVVDG
jgi:hypothetical protein